jgi:hypothetical protein
MSKIILKTLTTPDLLIFKLQIVVNFSIKILVPSSLFVEGEKVNILFSFVMNMTSVYDVSRTYSLKNIQVPVTSQSVYFSVGLLFHPLLFPLTNAYLPLKEIQQIENMFSMCLQSRIHRAFKNTKLEILTTSPSSCLPPTSEPDGSIATGSTLNLIVSMWLCACSVQTRESVP